MAACSFHFCAPGIFWCSYRGSLSEVTRKEVFAVRKELGAQMWKDVQHPKKYLKKASLGVLTVQGILLLHRFPNPAKQIAALDYIGTRNTHRIFGAYTVHAYSSSLSGVCRYNELFLLWQDNRNWVWSFSVPELIRVVVSWLIPGYELSQFLEGRGRSHPLFCQKNGAWIAGGFFVCLVFLFLPSGYLIKLCLLSWLKFFLCSPDKQVDTS